MMNIPEERQPVVTILRSFTAGQARNALNAKELYLGGGYVNERTGAG